MFVMVSFTGSSSILHANNPSRWVIAEPGIRRWPPPLTALPCASWEGRTSNYLSTGTRDYFHSTCLCEKDLMQPGVAPLKGLFVDRDPASSKNAVNVSLERSAEGGSDGPLLGDRKA